MSGDRVPGGVVRTSGGSAYGADGQPDRAGRVERHHAAGTERIHLLGRRRQAGGPVNGVSAVRRKNSRRASVGPAAGRAASTASATARAWNAPFTRPASPGVLRSVVLRGIVDEQAAPRSSGFGREGMVCMDIRPASAAMRPAQITDDTISPLRCRCGTNSARSPDALSFLLGESRCTASSSC